MDSARSLIVQKLLNADPALGLQTIRGTSNVQAVLRSGWQAPGCFVWMSRRRSPKESGCSVKHLSVEYSVLFALKLEKDDGSVEDSAERFSNRSIQVLDDWRPFGQGKLAYRDGDALVDLKRNLLFWADTYTLQQYVRRDGEPVAGVPALRADTNETLWMLATVPLSGQRVVVYSELGAQYADPTNRAHALQSPGLSLMAAAAGESVRIQTAGNVANNSFAWPVGTALFLGPNGTLTDTAPSTGLLWRLASVVKPRVIYFEPDSPVWRGE